MYLTAAGLPRGPRAASLVTAHNLLVWKHKVGVGKAGGKGIDPVWPDRWERDGSPRIMGLGPGSRTGVQWAARGGARGWRL